MHLPDDPTPHVGKRSAFGRRLTNYFLTGLVIAGPLAIAIYVTWWFIGLIDSVVKPLLPAAYNPDNYLPVALPGVGVVVAVVGIVILGFLTATLVGRSLITFGESVLARIPFFSVLYRGLKQIFETVVSQSKTNFREVGLIEYPRPGLYALVFVSTTAKGEVAEKVEGEDIVSVFLPTTPNPTSGYLLFLPRKDVQVLNMTIEDGAKLVISAGLVMPEQRAKELAGQIKHKAAEHEAEKHHDDHHDGPGSNKAAE